MEGNDLFVSLMKSDENLDRQELTTLERGEQHRRRKEINEMSHPQTKHSSGPKRRSYRAMKRRAFRAPAANIPSKTESTPAPILEFMPLDTGDHGGVGGRGSGMNLVRLSLRDLWVSIRQLIARRQGVQGKRQSPIAPELAVECMTQFEVKQKAERLR